MRCEACDTYVTRLTLRGTRLLCDACCAMDKAGQAPGVIRDEIPGGFVQEHFGVQPETFYSWSAMRKRADELGLQPFVRRLEKIREGDYIDPQTMENARILLSRSSSHESEPDPGRLETLELTVRKVSL